MGCEMSGKYNAKRLSCQISFLVHRNSIYNLLFQIEKKEDL